MHLSLQELYLFQPNKKKHKHLSRNETKKGQYGRPRRSMHYALPTPRARWLGQEILIHWAGTLSR